MRMSFVDIIDETIDRLKYLTYYLARYNIDGSFEGF